MGERSQIALLSKLNWDNAGAIVDRNPRTIKFEFDGSTIMTVLNVALGKIQRVVAILGDEEDDA